MNQEDSTYSSVILTNHEVSDNTLELVIYTGKGLPHKDIYDLLFEFADLYIVKDIIKTNGLNRCDRPRFKKTHLRFNKFDEDGDPILIEPDTKEWDSSRFEICYSINDVKYFPMSISETCMINNNLMRSRVYYTPELHKVHELDKAYFFEREKTEL